MDAVAVEVAWAAVHPAAKAAASVEAVGLAEVAVELDAEEVDSGTGSAGQLGSAALQRRSCTARSHAHREAARMHERILLAHARGFHTRGHGASACSRSTRKAAEDWTAMATVAGAAEAARSAARVTARLIA